MRWFTGLAWSNESRAKPAPSELLPPTTPPLFPPGEVPTSSLTPGASTVTASLVTEAPPVASQPARAASNGGAVTPRKTARRSATGSRTSDVVILVVIGVILFLIVMSLVTSVNSSRKAANQEDSAVTATRQDNQTRWALWFDAQWANGASTKDPSRRAEACSAYLAGPAATTREAASEMWRVISRDYPEFIDQGLTSGMLYDGFTRNLRETCA